MVGSPVGGRQLECKCSPAAEGTTSLIEGGATSLQAAALLQVSGLVVPLMLSSMQALALTMLPTSSEGDVVRFGSPSQAAAMCLQARGLAAFLTPMMEYVPDKRATAAEMLSHPWLTQQSDAEESSSPHASRRPPDAHRQAASASPPIKR